MRKRKKEEKKKILSAAGRTGPRFTSCPLCLRTHLHRRPPGLLLKTNERSNKDRDLSERIASLESTPPGPRPPPQQATRRRWGRGQQAVTATVNEKTHQVTHDFYKFVVFAFMKTCLHSWSRLSFLSVLDVLSVCSVFLDPEQAFLTLSFYEPKAQSRLQASPWTNKKKHFLEGAESSAIKEKFVAIDVLQMKWEMRFGVSASHIQTAMAAGAACTWETRAVVQGGPWGEGGPFWQICS